jgi:elongation factor 1-beta
MKFEIGTTNGLKDFNEHLLFYSYVEGYTPSKEDNDMFNSLDSCPQDQKNVARWYRHINSFTPDERAAWPDLNAPAEEEVQEEAPTEEAPAEETTQAVSKKEEEEFSLFDEEETEETEEDAEHQREIERRAKEQNDKKKLSGKVVIAKSSVLFDVKPYDSETDMKDLEEKVRSIALDGLEWKASRLVDLCYGIKKLQINAIVLDDKVSVDDVTEKIQEFEDVVQSVDIAAFNKAS